MEKPVKTPKRTRRERAAATRERMIHAAIEVFAEAGYVGARMTDIAARADVAVQTVYFVFHTKAELLQACFDHAVLGPDRLPPQQQPFFAEISAAESGRAALAAFVRGNTAILTRVAVIKEVAESASHEPDAVAVVERSEQLRRDGLGQVVDQIAGRWGLRPGLDAADAVDLLLMLSTSGPFLELRRYGWSDTKYAEWLTDALTRELLG
ncbi:TetR family transcriptional regulator [Kribbella sp. VKM Ac-2569]|uniref:TetR/AcrR family transcriptional regulator n=1 Tax=Kribbella sp. VKM Ac-2569 TaxID=2512220 RepID=UPI00102BEC94|nr:TetR/AcrR family transcriptional regulator [Kribbella sp. VKM Ac-2569]RZT27148.1 TetR family transcriptional regulator [Kribbella sp. VKM Ac-2569]